MKKKMVGLFAALVLAVTCAAGCGGGERKFEEYTDSEEFRFYAYMTPPPANTGTGELSGNPDFMTDEQYGYMAECGFNYAIPIYEGSLENNLKAMDGLAKYGIKFLPHDNSFAALSGMLNEAEPDAAEVEATKASIATNMQKYLERDNFAGIYASDEPSATLFPGLKAAGEYFKSFGRGEWWINVHPNSASLTLLGAESYVAYLDDYAKNSSIDRMSFDSYPLMNDGLKEGHLANLGQVAAVAKANGLDFDSFILTMGHHDYRTTDNYDDIAWQVYAAMAFGTKGIETFTYWTTQTTGENVTHGLVDYYGNRTQTWYSMQEVISEVKSFEKMYMNAEWTGVLGYTADQDYPNFSLSGIPQNIETPDGTKVPVLLSSHPRISKMKAEKDFLLGTFRDKDERDAFLLVNISDPAEDVANEVTLTFKDCNRVMLYKKGRKILMDVPGGVFKTTIGSGEGYYIIPLK